MIDIDNHLMITRRQLTLSILLVLKMLRTFILLHTNKAENSLKKLVKKLSNK